MKQTPVLSLCFVVIILVSYAGGQTCPSNGILCYPQDCSPQYRQCSGSTFYAVQNTPSGTLCKAGQIVYPSDCPSSSASSSTAASSTSAKASTTSSSSTSAKVSTTSTSSSSSGSTTGSTSTTCSLSNIFSSSDFSTLFPNANGAAKRGDAKQYAIFNYTSLIDAAKSYPTFACTGDIATRKKELAAFLAQTSQETSGWWSGQPYQWGYFFSTESCLGANTCGAYCSAGTYPCASGKIYCGRGPIQLSWNYNYGQISKALFGDSSILINNPDLVLTDATTAFKTALWFWMTTQSPKPSCHDVITGGWTPSSTDINAGRLAGFGMLTNIINGGIECGQASTASNNRIGYFQAYTNYFQVSPGANLVCDKMQSY